MAKNAENTPRFPLFVDLSGVCAAVFGGGPVAARRANVLADFGADVTVISPEHHAALDQRVRYTCRAYIPGDCAGYELVLAATSSREANHAVSAEARRLGIPVNVSDAPEECDFFFPAVARRGPLVVGVTASGTDHSLAKETAGRIRERFDELAPGKESGDAEA